MASTIAKENKRKRSATDYAAPEQSKKQKATDEAKSSPSDSVPLLPELLEHICSSAADNSEDKRNVGLLASVVTHVPWFKCEKGVGGSRGQVKMTAAKPTDDATDASDSDDDYGGKPGNFVCSYQYADEIVHVSKTADDYRMIAFKGKIMTIQPYGRCDVSREFWNVAEPLRLAVKMCYTGWMAMGGASWFPAKAGQCCVYVAHGRSAMGADKKGDTKEGKDSKQTTTTSSSSSSAVTAADDTFVWFFEDNAWEAERWWFALPYNARTRATVDRLAACLNADRKTQQAERNKVLRANYMKDVDDAKRYGIPATATFMGSLPVGSDSTYFGAITSMTMGGAAVDRHIARANSAGYRSIWCKVTDETAVIKEFTRMCDESKNAKPDVNYWSATLYKGGLQAGKDESSDDDEDDEADDNDNDNNTPTSKDAAPTKDDVPTIKDASDETDEL